jgi:hypothetical protein
MELQEEWKIEKGEKKVKEKVKEGANQREEGGIGNMKTQEQRK